jgi:prepilin-type N-terminal cleavage/methylation domain-containing protein
MPFRRTAAFTLLEMLVASTVLALLVGVIFQLLAAASGSSATTDKRLDADTHARRVFERMAQDFSRMCLQRNAEIVLGACRTYVCVLKSTLQNARYRVFIQI